MTGNKARVRLLMVLSGAFACSSLQIAVAQTSAAAPAATTRVASAANNATMQPDLGGLEEIIVTSQKRSENLQNVPIAVTALSPAMLTAGGVDTGVTLSRLTPNLTITAGQGFFSPYLRGVGSAYATLGLESSVAVYMDDIYMSRPGSGLNDLNDVARIEVLKGPQGTLFGRNAAGGAIRFVTNDPTHELEANGSVTYGRFNQIAADGVVNIPISSTLAARFSYAHDNRDGFIRNIDPSKPALGNRDVDLFRAKLLWEPTDNFKVKVSADYSYKRDVESDVMVALAGAPTQLAVALGGLPSPGFYVTTQDYPLNYKTGDSSIQQSGAEVRADWDLGPLTLSSISGYRHVNYDARASDVDATNLPFQHNDFAEDSDSYSQELQLVSNGAGPFKYLAGFYYYQEVGGNVFNLYGSSVDGLFGVPSGPDVGTPTGGAVFGAKNRLSIDSYAPYVQASYDFTEQWQLLIGGRYTSEKKTLERNNVYFDYLGTSTPIFDELNTPLKFNKFTPKATITYKLTPDVMLYATYSKGFKSGGINTPAVSAADTVKPESLTSYELGWKTEFANVRFNGSGFLYNFDELQVQRVDAVTGGLRVENAASARIYGVESDITWAPVQRVELGWSGGWLHATYQNYLGDAYVPCVTNLTAVGCAAQGGLGYGTQHTNFAGQSFPNAPKLSMNARGQYAQPLAANRGSLLFSATLSWTDRFFWNPEHSLEEPSHTLLHAGITWHSQSDKYNVGIFGDNLLAQKINYLEARQSSGGWRVPGPPLTWGIRFGAMY
jgi:iron complex outermembrane recepter protein